ncbi:MAG: LicD family protein [Clostridia bacterium]|nr:LicD family protein [Clostridia bacterium]
MENNQGVSEKLKIVEKEMLEHFVRICEKEDLRYFVAGGTLLGAVRHKGFIPWDDDIDVLMPRADYELFLKKAQAYLPDNLFLQSFETDREYPCNFAKIRNSDTTFIESTLADMKINHGVYIDIFPLDYYPKKNSRLFELKKLILTLRISADFKIDNQKLKTKTVRKLLKILMPDRQKAVRMKEKLFTAVPESDMLVSNCGAWGKREIFPAEWCSEYVDLTFEGVQVKAPYKYHELLSQLYGDYMKLPDEKDRVSHHYCDVIDTERSFKEV